MSSPAIERMHNRVREVRARAMVRAFEYRQRHHAAGVWYRVRRALAAAKAVYVIPVDAAEMLVSEGHVEAACGRDLEPVKRLVFVSDERLSRLPEARPIAVGLGAEFLEATALALVPFGDPPSMTRD